MPRNGYTLVLATAGGLTQVKPEIRGSGRMGTLPGPAIIGTSSTAIGIGDAFIECDEPRDPRRNAGL